MVEVRARIERKAPSLPRFVVISPDALSAWSLQGTTVVEVRLNGIDIGRRSLKHWGPRRDVWFLDVTEQQCRDVGVETGDVVRIELRRASTEPPKEIFELIRSEPALAERWAALTPARKRQVAEHVRAAKRSETRARRARKALS